MNFSGIKKLFQVQWNTLYFLHNNCNSIVLRYCFFVFVVLKYPANDWILVTLYIFFNHWNYSFNRMQQSSCVYLAFFSNHILPRWVFFVISSIFLISKYYFYRYKRDTVTITEKIVYIIHYIILLYYIINLHHI